MGFGVLGSDLKARPRSAGLGLDLLCNQPSLGLQAINPIPPGRYYITLSNNDDIIALWGLLRDAQALGVVKIEVEDVPDPGVLGTRTAFFLFEVLPVGKLTVDIGRFGGLTKAAPCVKKRADTEKMPDAVKWAMIGVGAVVLLYALSAVSNVSRAVTAVEESS